jgi:hypothetical protein
LRDELLNGEMFYTPKEAQVIIERWRIGYNAHRPHSSLGYLPTAPEILELLPNLQIMPWPEMTRLDSETTKNVIKTGVTTGSRLAIAPLPSPAGLALASK